MFLYGGVLRLSRHAYYAFRVVKQRGMKSPILRTHSPHQKYLKYPWTSMIIWWDDWAQSCVWNDARLDISCIDYMKELESYYTYSRPKNILTFTHLSM